MRLELFHTSLPSSTQYPAVLVLVTAYCAVVGEVGRDGAGRDGAVVVVVVAVVVVVVRHLHYAAAGAAPVWLSEPSSKDMERVARAPWPLVLVASGGPFGPLHLDRLASAPWYRILKG